MDGLKLCEKLKNDIKTSHIPIILLTAKASVEQQLEGLNTNADDYITKPFNLSILDARIKNLLRERKYLKERFKNAVEIDTKQLELSSIDQRFIDKAIRIIENNLSDVEFSVDDFARELGMSRSSMYRKILAITGQSAKEFIRDFRIKKAAKLLKEGEFNVSEVAFEVGFISRSYFTKCFTEYFKMLPSKYAQAKGITEVTKDSADL
jgi:AraC-like DNA-binding protein